MQQLTPTTNYNVAIYCRLSVDDGTSLAESVSINNQKRILENYVKENNWKIYDYYCDDGYSGTNFNRPEFTRMILDIEQGNINMVITKDLSRLGREYLKIGFYIDEYFPDHNVRYIALNDNVDTLNKDDELIPFKNIINEMYAKDISRKIRFSTQNNIKKGIDNKTAIPCYGYMYLKNDKRVINKDTAPVVKMLFNYYKSGYSLKQIANIFEKQKILTPMAYAKSKFNYDYDVNDDNKYKWNLTVLQRMISDTAYIGTLTRGKTISRFKSKHQTKASKDEVYTFENKFEPIIDLDTFYECQRLREKFINQRNNRTEMAYTKICYCGKCGNKLRFKSDVKKNGVYERLTCRTPYEEEKGTILVSDLEEVLKNELMDLKEKILLHEDEFIKLSENFKINENDILKNSQINETINSLKMEKSKIDLYIKKAFEQYSLRLLPEDTYKMMIKNYKIRQESLDNDIKEITSSIKNVDTIDYQYESKKILEVLQSLPLDNCLDMINVTSLISKLYISTDGIKRRRAKQTKFINIIYYKIDPLIKEFLTNE